MLFNSFSFLAFFAAIVIVYYRISHERRWILLVAGSLAFYGAFRPAYVLLLLGVTSVAYGAALAIDASADPRRKRALLALGVASVLAALFVFKYYDFFVATIDAGLLTAAPAAAPVFPRLNLVVAAGLSFYTFSCAAYLADVYAGRLRSERHFGYFSLYVSFFPKLLAGPIERARPFLAQVRRPVSFSDAGVTAGLQLMLWGLFKKVVIADRLAAFVDTAYRQSVFASPADLLLATYFFAFQLYCDFSGYSDIAIGAALVLGFDLMENFRRPYFSTSVPEFWTRRWHLSLATWFRDYLYIPMGGNRVSRTRQAFNVMAVFLASGLWHGANWTFVAWGGLNGLYHLMWPAAAAVGRRLTSILRLPRAVGALVAGLCTFHLILVTWVFFRAASLGEAATILERIARSAPRLPALFAARVTSGEMLVSLALVAVLLGVEAMDERRSIWLRLGDRPVYVRWAAYYALLFGLIVLGTWDLQQFVYMQF